MIRRCLPLLLPGLLAAAPAGAATLAEALHHWTGLTTDVTGRGEHVTVDLPPSSPVPQFTARAQQTAHAGDQGWQLTDVAVPQSLRLRGGEQLTLQDQHGHGWLGERTVQAEGQYRGIAISHEGQTMRVDHAAVSIDDSGGPVALSMNLDGLHVDAAGGSPLIPQHASLRGHTTPEGATALSAMIDGRPSRGAPVTIDQASFDVGPAHFNGTGTVTIVSPQNRQGELTITAQHFKDLLKQMPMDGNAARAYPVLMLLRSLGQKEGDHLTWTVAFAGPRVLVDGIDIGPLMGL
jgi:hypothetical protein